MKCRKCGNENVNVQKIAITKNKKKGLFYWLFCIWIIDLLLWLFLTLPMLIIKIFKPKKVKTIIKTEAVCQDCGYSWKV